MDLSQFSLEGKVALITGGSRGIGEAAAIQMAKAGADIVVSSRKLPDLERVAGEVEKLGRKAIAVETHAARLDQLQNLVDTVMKEFGRIDILVNNAGTGIAAKAMDVEEKAWDAVMNLNLKGVFFLSQAAARVMKEKGSGNIINVVSVNSYKTNPLTCIYSIAKAGLVMATKSMALEWAEHGIRVNAIAPGYVETKFLNASWYHLSEEDKKAAKVEAAEGIPLGRIGEPKEIADAMIFLASQASSYITGRTYIVDGGILLK